MPQTSADGIAADAAPDPIGAEVIARSDPASNAAVSYTVYLHSPVSG